MKKKEKRWRSPSLGKTMTLHFYGTNGTPLLALPTHRGTSLEWEEKGMVQALHHQLSEGYNQLFCVGSIDEESFFNETVQPQKRLMRQQQFESYITEEVLPFIHEQNESTFTMIGGTGMGGYHAVNLALKNPKLFDKAIGISGLYEIRPFFESFYNDDVYYNNPVDFVPNLHMHSLLKAIRAVDFRLVSYQGDAHESDARRLSHTMRSKMIDHTIDIWNETPDGEWEIWKQMIKSHII